MPTAIAGALAVTASALLAACQAPLAPTKQPSSEAGAEGETPTHADRALMRSFVAFARSPTDANWRKLPLARTVGIGLGSRLVLERSAAELRDPEEWTIHVDSFRAYGGPFSALRLMARERGPLQVSAGPHRHCAAPRVIPPPRRVESLRRVSVHPQRWESCLRWWTVDVYVDGVGEVHAVTLDAWEP